MKVLIAGATGLVGHELLQCLVQENQFEEITVLSRRPFSFPASKVKVLLAELGEHWLDALEGQSFDAVVCTLGTTIKVAGSQEAFRKVDLDAVLALAHFTEASHSKQFLVVSSLGANSNSMSFYSKTKGQMEAGVRALSIPGISILRPSLLIGDRAESRLGEKLAKNFLSVLNPLLVGGAQKFKGIPAKTVARCLMNLMLQNKSGTRVLESDEISEVAHR